MNFQRFPDFKEMQPFTHRLLDRVKTLPGVESVAVAGNHPLDQGSRTPLSLSAVKPERELARDLDPARDLRFFPVMAVGRWS